MEIVGETIGRYRLVRRLGVGGMAETFEAEERGSGSTARRVCVKRILPAFAADPEYLALFARETRHAARLVHPCIVQVLDAAEAPTPYLVLELVDGLDLRALLTRMPGQRLLEPACVTIAAGLAEALAYAHEGGANRPALVHRDLSSSNVLLSRGGDVKLADFGLAKPLDGGVATHTNSMRGKIPYLAPEVMRGEPATAKSDLFALGVLLFECLTGRRPFDGAHEVETMTRILAGRGEPLARHAPGVHPTLIETVNALIAHDAADRPEDALAVLEALDGLESPLAGRLHLAREVDGRLGGVTTRPHVLARPAFARRSVGDEARQGEEADDALATTRGRPPVAGRRSERGLREVAAPLAAIVALGSTVGVLHARHERARSHDAGRHDGTHPVAVRTSVTAPESSRPVPTRDSDDAAENATARDPGGGRLDDAPPGLERRPTESRAAAATEPEHAPPVAGEAPPGPEPNRSTILGTATAEAHATERAPSPQDRVDASAPRPARPEAPARLRVVVVPWGDLWIDGRPAGRAPQEFELTPGAHRIEYGQQGPAGSRRLDLVAGERRILEVDLEP